MNYRPEDLIKPDTVTMSSQAQSNQGAGDQQVIDITQLPIQQLNQFVRSLDKVGEQQQWISSFIIIMIVVINKVIIIFISAFLSLGHFFMLR